MDNVIKRIADFADLDTRRAMGFKPRKLKLDDVPPFRPEQIVFKYYVDKKILLFMETYEYGRFIMEVVTDVDYLHTNLFIFNTTTTKNSVTVYPNGCTTHLFVNGLPHEEFYTGMAYPLLVKE
jgi:hypothetical protein